mmetsp:Transcript_19755/g.50555  ORF Transcript_19755/g.50555 Transcript_19755/m.50555 type:complete len:135 (-) Transcript_19755:56-460(-)
MSSMPAPNAREVTGFVWTLIFFCGGFVLFGILLIPSSVISDLEYAVAIQNVKDGVVIAMAVVTLSVFTLFLGYSFQVLRSIPPPQSPSYFEDGMQLQRKDVLENYNHSLSTLQDGEEPPLYPPHDITFEELHRS